MKFLKTTYGLVLLLFIGILFSGCRTSFRSGWTNFNAYYNTFYNAKRHYQTGLDKVMNQNVDYNPEVPIRVHRKPLNAGSQDFQLAIEKGADILRKYDDSKWVDDALELIGKSYYFRQEYFSADQKFDELYSASTDLRKRQTSVLWKGKTLLELEVYNQGIAYLNDQLLEFEGQWAKDLKAEIHVVLAEIYIQNEDWGNARNNLETGVRDLPEKELKERSYFLLGQINERIGDREAALEAYDKVSDHFTEYRVQYLARRKKADMARTLGRNDLALSIFNSMVRDDKNTEFRAELNYELGRTEQLNGNIRAAEEIYKSILRNPLIQPDALTRAKTYYGLAEIYRFSFDDFKLAAAYYDSAAQQRADITKLPEDFNADELASSFGQYSDIKNDIIEQDSLLSLGKMSPEARDSAIAIVRARKIAELEEQRRAQENQQNTLVNLAATPEQNESSNTANGFLNSANPVAQQQGRQAFRAIWGDRPLVDNWRYASILQRSIEDDLTDANEEGTAASDELMMVEMDLSRIPISEADQDSVENIISRYQYQLGNLFFLSLNDPDSAAYYFEKAYQPEKSNDINPAALYSLSELYDINGSKSRSRALAEELINTYPATTFALRLSEKYEMQLPVSTDSVLQDPLERYYYIRTDTSTTISAEAKQLITFSEEYRNTLLATEALNDAIQLYLKKAREEEGFQELQEVWLAQKQNRINEQKSFAQYQDSVSQALADTSLSLSDEERAGLQEIADSTLEETDLSEFYPYKSAGWDTVRTLVDQYLVAFRNGPHRSRLEILKRELAVPEEKPEQDTVATDAQEETELTESNVYVDCEEIDAELRLRGNARQVNSVFRAVLSGKEELKVRFYLNTRGIPDRYEILNEDLSEEQTSRVNDILNRGLSFEPILREGQAIKAACTYRVDLTE
ncbi:tetratricopeptide repeat protein [Balneola sp. MJW-20]|uniref:type IX secretion system periplasmic lipoprotein PorW/SprE n=1 Tax=Gracilimonas aurantiaca TaxID=3234185 RepID=UPI0034677754